MLFLNELRKIFSTDHWQTGNILELSTYTSLLSNPQKVNAENLKSLAEIIKEYPYFQSARALQLKGLKNQNSFLYNEALKITAAHTADRDILFEYITSEKFVQNEISKQIILHEAEINEITVFSENVTEQLSREIDEQIKAELKKAEAILSPDFFGKKPVSTDVFEQPETSPEKILQLEKPLEFNVNDTHSFSEWLQLTKVKPIQREVEKVENSLEKNSQHENPSVETNRKNQLIEKFILERPKIRPSENISAALPDITPYSKAPDSLMTETLAKVYLQQKNYKKAVQAYKILILKNPEKSGFFADQIRAIEKLINTE